MAKLSRRAFFHAFGLHSRPTEAESNRAREPRDSQKSDGEDKSNSADGPGTFQFSLMSIFVLTTVVGILLSIAKIWPEHVFLVAVLAALLAERIYRKRIKASLGARNYERAAWILRRLFAAADGAILGTLVGLILSIVVFRTWSPIAAGGFLGAMLGLIFCAWRGPPTPPDPRPKVP